MRLIVVTWLACFSLNAFALEAEVYVGGRYTCEFDTKPAFVKARGPFTLEIIQNGVQSRTRKMQLRSSDQFELTAGDFSGSTFHKVETDFPIKKKKEVAYIYITGDEAQSNRLDVSLAFNTEPDIFEFDRLKCTGESMVKKVPIVQLDCELADFIKEVPTSVRVRFSVANLGEPQDFLVLNYSGAPSQDATVEVTPKRSYFSSLNNNLNGSLRRDYVLLSGDAKGKFVSHIRIDRPSLTRGIAWLESGTQEVLESRRPVTCSVKGVPTPPPQERLH